MSPTHDQEPTTKPSAVRGCALLVIAGIIAMPLAGLGLLGAAAGGSDSWFWPLMTLLLLIPLAMAIRGVAELLDVFSPTKGKTQ